MPSRDFVCLSFLINKASMMSRAAVYFGGGLTIASVLLIAYDICLRRLFGITVGGADELSGYAFAISSSWALAFTALERANVRVDVLYQYLPLRISALVDWLALVALGVFSAYLSYFAYDVVMSSWVQDSAANTPLATPLWMPQGLWLAGLAWFSVVLALMLLRASIALITGDIEVVKQLCGVKSAKEEAATEVALGQRIVRGETV
ncbi:TRAP transporter small permease [Pseudomonas benzenivorans]|uniref:TRAP transporter small permease protein n=1 Tax=Pseudomonas benzenivorans TaxID=556533 RepID=A0ABZ0PYD4_9PSED|nr:TRAP transporter small permease [Pseudomonas benzenivorans]WPC06225.1 TRAP transporter small permease [Pseudomonas benzenivorans]